MPHVIRTLLLALGVVSLGLGVAGIFLPVMPTTPFLLVAAACFVRSSDRLHRWLLEHRLLGRYVSDFQSGKGIPARAKALSLATVWVSIVCSSACWVVSIGPRPAWYAAVAFMLASALWGTYYIGVRTPTRRSEPAAAPEPNDAL